MTLYYAGEPNAQVATTLPSGESTTFTVRGGRITEADRTDAELLTLPGVTATRPADAPATPSVPPVGAPTELTAEGDR